MTRSRRRITSPVAQVTILIAGSTVIAVVTLLAM
jgi:hypothetical protein